MSDGPGPTSVGVRTVFRVDPVWWTGQNGRMRVVGVSNEHALGALIDQANQLKDPDSAEFRSVKITSRDPAQGWTVVGEFNANNSFGGKVGYTVFTCSATMKDSETVTATAVLME